MALGYQDFLQDEFNKRKAANPAYSLRAFSRDMGVSTASLSQVFSGKRDLSKSSVFRIAEKLCLSPEQILRILSEATPRKKKDVLPQEYFNIEEDTFRLISDWYCFAILTLARMPASKATPKWIAGYLGISVSEAKGALRRLVRLKLIRIDGSKLVRTSNPIRTTTNIPSAALRKHHKQNLKLTEISIDRDPLSRRENTSITMAIDPKRIPEAKERMLKFRQSLSDFLEGGDQTEVFTFSMHLFPTNLKKG